MRLWSEHAAQAEDGEGDGEQDRSAGAGETALIEAHLAGLLSPLELLLELLQLAIHEGPGALGLLGVAGAGRHLAGGLGLLDQLLEQGRIPALLPRHLELTALGGKLLIRLLLHQLIPSHRHRQRSGEQYGKKTAQNADSPLQRGAALGGVIDAGGEIHQHQTHQGHRRLVDQPLHHQLTECLLLPVPEGDETQHLEEQHRHQRDPDPAKQRAVAGGGSERHATGHNFADCTDHPVDSHHPADLAAALKDEARALGFDPVGIAAVPGGERIPLRTAALERWLAAGHQASMGWMADPRRRAVEELLPGVRSLLAVGLNYHVEATPQPGSLRVARYGWGRDYHRVIDGRLRQLGRWLEQRVPGLAWRACVDSAPLMDKAWAEEAGLGWIGKNGNLIHRQRGSWLLIGHLLIGLELPADQPAQSLCGRCNLCLQACPTGALPEPFVVDARRCIAFHTIENRDPELPEAIGKQLHGWVAGCDLCQEVCPWNRQPLEPTSDPDLQPRPWLLNLQAQEALAWSDQDWEERLRASALRRIKPWMWRRNLQAASGGTDSMAPPGSEGSGPTGG
jgi:epoxyqueuosine reductase